MKLNKLVPDELMIRMIAEGYIRVTFHPTEPLRLYNYTEKAQFSREWNDATRVSRGLIVRDDDEIVARPFPKFFNYGEANAPSFSMNESVVVTDKVDGSLGVLYPIHHPEYGTEFAVSTRGSFQSDQAKHATQVWRDRYGYRFEPPYGWTMLFEIVYPENRIVVDYEGQDDLILLGGVHIGTGSILSSKSFPDWPGPRAEVFPYKTFHQALSAPLRPGKEGLVVRATLDDAMVKIKQPEYVELHRIVTGLNEKAIWEKAKNIDLSYQYIGVGDLVAQTLDGIPDEMHEWVTSVVRPMATVVKTRLAEANDVFARSQSQIDYGNHKSNRQRKKVFAEWLHAKLGIPIGRQKGNTGWLKSTVFMIYDGMDPRPFLWKLVKPKEEK